jgi:hypothetical protein
MIDRRDVMCMSCDANHDMEACRVVELNVINEGQGIEGNLKLQLPLKHPPSF